jgi:hypothetical protein
MRKNRAKIDYFMHGNGETAAGDFDAHDAESEIFGVSESHNTLAAS